MRDVICFTQEYMDTIARKNSKWDSLEDCFDDRYPPNLRDRNLDWEVRAPIGGLLGFAERFNDQSPNGRVRDITQRRFDLYEWSPENQHSVIKDRITGALKGKLGKQVYAIKFYQVPAPRSSQRHPHRKKEYLEEVFRAQDAISDEQWIREPQILLGSGGEGTILADAEDAEWVADMYPQLKEKYSDIGFLVDLKESPDPEGVLRALPDESVRKLRVTSFAVDVSVAIPDNICRSLII